MQALLDWLVELPSGILYAMLVLTAAIENVFPPFPSDVVVAFGSFVAAQGRETMLGVFLSVWLGNIGGALLVYALGRRYGAERLERRLAGKHAESRDQRLRVMFKKYGMAAVFVSRFIPGVRAVVPAFAGALRLPLIWFAAMIASASGIWYGLITVIAFRVGSDWEQLSATVTRYSATIGVVAAVILALAIAAWLVTRKRLTRE